MSAAEREEKRREEKGPKGLDREGLFVQCYSRPQNPDPDHRSASTAIVL